MGGHKKLHEDERVLIDTFKEMAIITGCLEDVKRIVMQLKTPTKTLWQRMWLVLLKGFLVFTSVLWRVYTKGILSVGDHWYCFHHSYQTAGRTVQKKNDFLEQVKRIAQEAHSHPSGVFCLLHKVECEKFSKIILSKENSYPFWVRSDMENTFHLMGYCWSNDSCCLSSVLRKILRLYLGLLKKSADTNE